MAHKGHHKQINFSWFCALSWSFYGFSLIGPKGAVGTEGTLERAQFCLVDNKEYALGQPFSFDQDCFRFKCFCSEDGSWNCPADDSQNLCGRTDKRGRAGKTYYRRTTSTRSKGMCKTSQ